MPGTTEPFQLFNGVFVANHGVFWMQASMTTNTVVTVTSDSIDIYLDDTSIEVIIQ